jgi:hypothetical protein
MYLEDIELSLRAKLLGYRILCNNEAVITHDYVQNLTANKFFYLERNRLLTLFIIARRHTLLRMSVALLLTELATWAYALLKGSAYISARWRVLRWFFQEKRTWQAMRTDMQQRRRTGDGVWLADALEALPFEQLMDSNRMATWLNRLTRPLYVLLRPRVATSRVATSRVATSASPHTTTPDTTPDKPDNSADRPSEAS